MREYEVIEGGCPGRAGGTLGGRDALDGVCTAKAGTDADATSRSAKSSGATRDKLNSPAACGRHLRDSGVRKDFATDLVGPARPPRFQARPEERLNYDGKS